MKVLKKYVYSFSATNVPEETCKDGEIVQFVTEDCFGGQIRTENDTEGNIDFNHTNPATGPLYVEGAEAGDVLAVDILDIEVADHGAVCTVEPYGCMWEGCDLRTKILKVTDNVVQFNDVSWQIEPMIGVIGTASDENVSSGFSFNGGDNMDSRLITEGVTVYLPVRCKGALLAMGDLHASMGDGEVCETGIEIAGKVTVRVRVIKNFELNWPVTETEDEWYVNTNGNTCDKAIRRGYEELCRLLMNAYGWDYTDTVMYMSLMGRISANQACLDPGDIDNEGPTFRVGIAKNKDKPKLIG